ncbi:D-alanyl-D-alanine carboxypeptidase family protein [Clostridium sp. CF012]|uniref:M15 family metallopeptidase n=1 Tax=Clostridium sp. CF012 TaxID=2843319 RepID=UPI001C0C6C78|nr:M15 family metallopeptidase [Clostridium sp. CF012]MBU3145489.1 M15 family metallopeptidase [Clostridium sp. CF012]
MKKKIIISLILGIIGLMYINSRYGSLKVIGDVIERNIYIEAVNDMPNENSNVDDGILILVNRKNELDKDYVPDHLKVPNIRFYSTVSNEEMQMNEVAGDALKKLFKKSEQEGIILYALSGYRSYATQEELYKNSIKTNGKGYTYNYVAKAGKSEHQSGLAMDITNSKKSTGFEYTKEGIWLKDNAYKFGFIIRYGKGKKEVTGYNYEPWHVRYVGTKNSEEIYSKDITLEEFLKP